MQQSIDFWSLWYFHIPNYIFAFASYLLMGRIILGFLVDKDWDNYIWRSFLFLTKHIYQAVAFVTPSFVPEQLIIVFAILWLWLLRILLFLLLIV